MWLRCVGLTSETEPCRQAVVDFLYMQVESSVELSTCFLSFSLQVGQKLIHSNTRGNI